MAVIFSYPTKATPVGADKILISDTEDSNKTKNASIASIKTTIDVVDSVIAGTGISVSSATGNVTIGNTGVTSLVAGSNISISGATGAVTISTAASNVDGAGTLNKIPVWQDSNTIGDSIITQEVAAGGVDIAGFLGVTGAGNYISAPSIKDVDGTTGSANQVLGAGPSGGAIKWVNDTDTTYEAGDGLDLTGATFSTDLKANSGLVIDTTELSMDLGATGITGTLSAENGGTGNNIYTIGDMLYANSATSLTKVELGSAGQVLTVNAGATAPEWAAAGGGVVTSYTNGTDNNILTSTGATTINGESNFTYDGTTGALTLGGQLVATANAGTNTAIRGVATNSQSNQGWATDLGVANFDQNDTGVNCTTIAVNTESTNGKLISFYYQENSGTGPKGEIKYDVPSAQVQYNVTSDYRLKENVVDLTSAVDRVKNLKPKRFNLIGNATEIDGFLAHEVQEVVPQAVSGTKDQVFEDGQVNPQQMDASKLVPVLTAAIKELTARIEALEA